MFIQVFFKSSPGLEPDVHPIGVWRHHMLQNSSTGTKLKSSETSGSVECKRPAGE